MSEEKKAVISDEKEFEKRKLDEAPKNTVGEQAAGTMDAIDEATKSEAIEEVKEEESTDKPEPKDSAELDDVKEATKPAPKDEEEPSAKEDPGQKSDAEVEEKSGDAGSIEEELEGIEYRNALPVMGNPEEDLFTIALEAEEEGLDLLAYAYGSTPEKAIRVYGSVFGNVNFRTKGRWDPRLDNKKVFALAGDAIAQSEEY